MTLRNRRLSRLCAVITLWSGFSTPPAWADPPENGGFEDPPLPGGYEYIPGGMTTISGWQTILFGVERFDPHIYSAGAAQDGSLVLDLNTDYGVGGGIQQTFSTTIGGSYVLSFYGGTWLAFGRDGTGHIEVLIDGASHPFTVTNPTETIAWTQFSIAFQATASDTTVVFRSFDSPSQTFSLIDHVSLSPVSSDSDGDGLLDLTEIALAQGSGCPDPLVADSDGDGISDGQEVAVGTNTCNSDTDGDGLLDGTEVDMAQAGGCPSPLNADSDGDSLSDGQEVVTGTNSCNPDSDGDGVPDLTDPLPSQPGVTCGFLEQMMRSLAANIEGLPLALFNGANANANNGRRNSLATRIQNAANHLCDGQGQSAIANLHTVLERVNGPEITPDWMVESAERAAVKETIELLIGLTLLLG